MLFSELPTRQSNSQKKFTSYKFETLVTIVQIDPEHYQNYLYNTKRYCYWQKTQHLHILEGGGNLRIMVLLEN